MGTGNSLSQAKTGTDHIRVSCWTLPVGPDALWHNERNRIVPADGRYHLVAVQLEVVPSVGRRRYYILKVRR